MVDESSLTGEALAVTKDAGDDVLGGAVVQSGEREMLVTRTGGESFFGKTLALLATVEVSPLCSYPNNKLIISELDCL